jgi:hypothetical protein
MRIVIVDVPEISDGKYACCSRRPGTRSARMSHD